MKKYLILTLTFLMLYGFSALSQEEEETTVVEEEEVVDEPIKGGCLVYRFTGSMVFGRHNFIGGLSVPSSIRRGSNYGGSAPPLFGMLKDDKSAVSMAGVQGRLFITDEIAVKLAMAGGISRTPSQEYVQGFSPAGGVGNAGVIPAKNQVNMDRQFAMYTSLGGEYHFRKKNLSPFLGVSFPFYYERRSIYNPKYTVSSSGVINIVDVDTRHAELFGFGANLVAGADYYFKSNFFIGFEIEPFSFVYAYEASYPAPGIAAAKADTFGYGIFSRPLFKVGFVFN